MGVHENWPSFRRTGLPPSEDWFRFPFFPDAIRGVLSDHVLVEKVGSKNTHSEFESVRGSSTEPQRVVESRSRGPLKSEAKILDTFKDQYLQG